MQPVCYYDTGAGFNEEQKLYGEYRREGSWYTFDISVPTDARLIRIDPVLTGGRCVAFTQLKVDNQEIEYSTHNMAVVDEKKLLVKKNPYIVFRNDKGNTHFKISIDLQNLTAEELEKYFQTIN